MEIKKSELVDLAKGRGLDIAEELLEKGAKELAHLVLDVLVKAANESENKWDDMVVVALEAKLRALADDIQVSL